MCYLSEGTGSLEARTSAPQGCTTALKLAVELFLRCCLLATLQRTQPTELSRQLPKKEPSA